MEDKITIDRKTLVALGVQTRLEILKSLGEKEMTLSELADRLKLAVPTVKEHLDVLLEAGLVKKEETERKWKYLSLTLKGRNLIAPREVRVLFAFGVMMVAAVPLEALLVLRLADLAVPPLLMGAGREISVWSKLSTLFIGHQDVLLLLIASQLALMAGAVMLGYLWKRGIITFSGRKIFETRRQEE